MAGIGRALVDRRDVTAQRSAVAAPSGNGQGVDLTLLVAALLDSERESVGLLRHLVAQEKSSVTALCVTDREPAQLLMRNFPVPGAQRLIVRRTGQGGQHTLAAGVATQLAAANENRLGLSVVNTGPNTVTLYLSTDLGFNSSAAQIALLSGAAWDGRLSSLLWCGSVTAVDTVGGSSLTVAEV